MFIIICGKSVTTLIIKEVKNLTLKDTHKFNRKEWCTSDVTNVASKHGKRKSLTDTCRRMYMEIAEMDLVALDAITKPQVSIPLNFTHSLSMKDSDMFVVNAIIKQFINIISKCTLQPSMVEKDSGVKSAITKVLQNNLLDFTWHQSIM